MLETIYMLSPFVSQIFIHGLSNYNTPVAVVIPNKTKILEFLTSNNLPLDESSYEATISNHVSFSFLSGFKIISSQIIVTKQFITL